MSLPIHMLQTCAPATAGRPLADLRLATLSPAARAVLSLVERGCRWPSGSLDDTNFHFCNDRAEPGRGYCAAHRRASRAGDSR